MNPAAIETYRTRYASFSIYAARLKELIIQLIGRSGSKVHFVESRAKTPESFAEKIRRPGKNYDNPMEEIPDLVGVRIVLYYTDSVQAVGELLKQEFNVIEKESGHQPGAYEADQFGYLSMHYVVTLHKKRHELPEWQDWHDVRAEIQVRTVLQHSWAAVSHALQYKREGDVPLGLRRRLHRLAGLFELADEEFVGIRNEAETINVITKAELQKNPDVVHLDAQSLVHFMNESAEFKKLRAEAIDLGYKFDLPDWEDDESDQKDFVGTVVENCHTLGIKFVADLKRALDFDAKPFLKAAKEGEWYVTDPFLLFLVLIKAKPAYFTVSMLKAEGFNQKLARRVVKVIKSTE